MSTKLTDFLLQEATRRSLARVNTHDTEGRNLGSLSAFTGSPDDMKQHRALGRELSKLARSHGYGFVPTKGVYMGGHELSYTVFGKKGPDDGHLQKVLEILGSKFKQSSVLHKAHDSKTAHLIGTKDEWEFGGKTLKRGEKVPVGEIHFNRPMKKEDDSRTFLKGKRSFDYGK